MKKKIAFIFQATKVPTLLISETSFRTKSYDNASRLARRRRQQTDVVEMPTGVHRRRRWWWPHSGWADSMRHATFRADARQDAWCRNSKLDRVRACDASWPDRERCSNRAPATVERSSVATAVVGAAAVVARWAKTHAHWWAAPTIERWAVRLVDAASRARAATTGRDARAATAAVVERVATSPDRAAARDSVDARGMRRRSLRCTRAPSRRRRSAATAAARRCASSQIASATTVAYSDRRPSTNLTHQNKPIFLSMRARVYKQINLNSQNPKEWWW